MQAAPAPLVPVPPVPQRQRLAAAQLLAMGEARPIAAAMAGLTPCELRALEADPDFLELLEGCRVIEALPAAEQNARLEKLLRRAIERMVMDERVGALGAGLRLLEHLVEAAPGEPQPAGAPESPHRGWPELAQAFGASARVRPGTGDPARVDAAAQAPVPPHPRPGWADTGADGEAEDEALDHLLDALDAAEAHTLDGRLGDLGALPDPIDRTLQSLPASDWPGPARARLDGREIASMPAPAAGRGTAPGPARAQAEPAFAPQQPAASAPAPSATASVPVEPDGERARRALARPTPPQADAVPARADQSQQKITSQPKAASRAASTPAVPSDRPPFAVPSSAATPPSVRAHVPAERAFYTADVKNSLPPPNKPPEPGSLDDLAARLDRLLALDVATSAEEADLAEAVCALKWPNWPGYGGPINLGRLGLVLHGRELHPRVLARLGSAEFTAPLRDPWHPANHKQLAAPGATISTGSRSGPAGSRANGRGKAAATPNASRSPPGVPEAPPTAPPRETADRPGRGVKGPVG